MKQKRWVVRPRLDGDLWRHLLLSRDLKTEEDQADFFSPSLANIVSPWDFPDMDKAVERIGRAIEAQEKMVVWGDFDCDGVTSTAILWETLHSLGAKVMPYIPNRDTEGHGFNAAALEKMASEEVKLIVTVDHGVTAFEEVELAKKLGMEVIVSDHHEPAAEAGSWELEAGRMSVSDAGTDRFKGQDSKFKFPNCVAVVHPFRLAEPQQLAGCGTAYLLAYGVWLDVTARRPFDFAQGLRHDGTTAREHNTSEVAEGLLRGGGVGNQEGRRADNVEAREEFARGRIELAALGTMADMMPLVGDNRILAAFGLRALRETRRPGLQELMKLAGIKPDKELTAYDVGFLIAPRINAPGRLADALESLRLLCSKDLGRAHNLAVVLDGLNRERQVLLEKVQTQAREVALARPAQGAYVLSSPDWPAGVCGLAAGRLVELLYRPVVVMEEQGEWSRGSARSIKGFDITAGLASMSELLKSYGGHAMAAGFVCKTADIPEIERRLSALVETQVPEEDLQPRLMIDAEVQLAELTDGLWDKLKLIEPCGLGNPQPVFVSYGLSVQGCRTMGNGGKHLKLTLSSSTRRHVDAQEAASSKSLASRIQESDNQVEPASANIGRQPKRADVSTIEAVAFGFGDQCEVYLEAGMVDVVFCLEENVWNGHRSLQLKVRDIRVAKQS